MRDAFGTLRIALAQRTPRILDEPGGRAAVSLLLRADAVSASLLLVRRAERENDPWSGHVAFPGGHIEPGDASPRDAAERETREELGLDLTRAAFIGRLDDVRGSVAAIVVSPFGYEVRGDPPLFPAPELAAAFWVSLGVLQDPSRRSTFAVSQRGGTVVHRAIQLDGPGAPQLWGLSLRIAEQLLELTSGPLPRTAPMHEG